MPPKVARFADQNSIVIKCCDPFLLLQRATVQAQQLLPISASTQTVCVPGNVCVCVICVCVYTNQILCVLHKLRFVYVYTQTICSVLLVGRLGSNAYLVLQLEGRAADVTRR